ncbi:MAG: restriction endonuclease [Crocinitomicaceae bacterium]
MDALLKLNEYHQGQYFEPISKGIKFNQFVGVLQVDGLTIEIHPKADKNEDDSKWKGVLLQMLKECGHLKANTSGAAHVKRQNLNLLEVYFELFLGEVNQLLHRGLIKQYRKETGNVKALKGKLEFAGNIRKNLVHKERFYTTHQVYDQNHFLHQVLAKALEIIEQFTRGTRLYDSCKRTQLDFPNVDSISISSKQLNTFKLNRKSAPYGYAFELARLIILNYSPDISSGREQMLSLLFDMNQLWEEYVLIQLRRYIQSQEPNFEITGQDRKPFWSSNYLQPDIVLRNKETGEKYIIDTKWKLPGTGSASMADLRQMYAYSRFWEADRAMLLYPGEEQGRKFKPFLKEDENHSCKMEFVNVVEQEHLNKDLGRQVFRKIIE